MLSSFIETNNILWSAKMVTPQFAGVWLLRKYTIFIEGEADKGLLGERNRFTEIGFVRDLNVFTSVTKDGFLHQKVAQLTSIPLSSVNVQPQLNKVLLFLKSISQN